MNDDAPAPFSPQLQRAAEALGRARHVCVVTGAGISAESGIPTFRDAQEGLWAQYSPLDLATPEGFERIHRSNLIGMGVLPLQFKDGESAQSLGLAGKESFEIIGLNAGAAKMVTVVATPATGAPIRFEARVRIDTPKEREYYQHGGILQYVLRQLAGASKAA